MRFSIQQILLFTMLFAIAIVIIQAIPSQQIRASWRHDHASSTIRHVRLWAAWNREANPSIEFSGYDKNQLQAEIISLDDPWGNRYQFVEREESGIFGTDSKFHVFSCGMDGKSNTNGNDADDINSWNYDRQSFYVPNVVNPFVRKMSRLGVVETVAIGGIMAIVFTHLVNRIFWTRARSG